MKRILLFLILFSLGISARSNNINMNIDPVKVMMEGNAFYSKNNFDQALIQYKTLLNAGFVSAALYYNVANTYYKTQNFKMAILYYERAKLLNPGDKDIDFNLGMARNNTVDKIEAMPEVFFMTWIKSLQNKFTEKSWALISLSTFLISLTMILFYLLSKTIFLKKLTFWMGILVFCVAIVSYLAGYELKEAQLAKNKAIIFTATVSAKSSPSETGNNLFILHEGTKVELMDHVGNWTQIKIADGSRGWVKTSDFEII